MATTKNPPVVIGPQTKRETKKTARVAKRAAKKVAPKVPMTVSGTAAAKAAKKKKRIGNIASIGSAIAGTIGMIAADARLARGKNRYYSENPQYKSPDPTMRQKWDMGKNQKSTKKSTKK
jgi:hypothetical protein